MNVEQSECVAGETEVLGENLSWCHSLHHKSHMTWHGLKRGPLPQNASNYSPELQHGPYNKLLCNAIFLAIHKEMSGKLSEKITVSHDNTHSYTTNLTITLVTWGWDIMNHLAYNPDLTSSDFHLFGPLKEHFVEQKL
jgi:hypothetical protein